MCALNKKHACPITRASHAALVVRKNSPYQCRRCMRREFSPWIMKIPWRRASQPTPVFFPEESHGQRSLEDYSSQGHQGSEMTEATQKSSYYISISSLYTPIYLYFPFYFQFCTSFLICIYRAIVNILSCIIYVLSSLIFLRKNLKIF